METMTEHWNAEIIYSLATELMEAMEHEEERHLDNMRRLEGLLENVQSHCPHEGKKPIIRMDRYVCQRCYALLLMEDKS